MAAKKSTAQAAAKQPEAKQPASKPEESKAENTSKQSPEVTGATTSQPGGGENEQSSAAGVGSTDSGNASTEDKKSATAPSEPETKSDEGDDEGKERGPAKDGNLPGDDDQASLEEGEITLEVVTRLPRRIRGGVIVTQEPREVVVTEKVAALIEADLHISATRK